jgi:NAD(P)H-binding
MRTDVIAVYGPTGYTGRQVVDELRRRGIGLLLVGRDPKRLRTVAQGSGAEVRVAGLDDPMKLRRAFDGAAAVINCVGPFQASAEPVVAAAVSAGAHYLDFTAEQAPLLPLAKHWDEPARKAGVAIVPAVGFYGGVGDLLASVTAIGIERPMEAVIGYAVDGWLLTGGSRATAAAVAGRRWVWREGRLELVTGAPRYGSFEFPDSRGTQPVMEDYPLPEVLTVPRHLRVPSVRLVMAASTLQEVFAADAPAPGDVSDEQRAGSRFTVVAAVSNGCSERYTVVHGRDIYGITAPIIAGAAEVLIGSGKAGMLAPSQAVDPQALLAGLGGRGLVVEATVARELVR